jgi:type III pantothenate kinase
MNLVIDIGNSRTKIAVFNHNYLTNDYSFAVFNEKELEKILEEYSGIDKAIISSVGGDPGDMYKMISGKIRNTIMLDENTPLPINNQYKSKNTLGKDRLAAVVGANFSYPGNDILVIDTGTAITYDFIDRYNNYSGGNISPGMAIRYKALHTFTGRLPLLSKQEVFPELGIDTNSAIISGVQTGIINEIEGYITHYLSIYNNIIIILTGGDANFFDKKLKNTIFVNLNLVNIGLNCILEHNAENL